jgi:hypothetical protein
MVEKRLSELELRVSMELKSLRQQDETFLADLIGLRDQMGGMHREFAQAVRAMVEEQVANQVEANVDVLRTSVEELQKSAAAAFDEKLAALREEMTARTSEITDLQQRVHDGDRNVLEVILGMGEMCRQIGERLGRQPAAEPRVEAPAEPEPQVNDVPGFAQQGGRGVLHIPLMSSFLLTGAGLYLLHLL